MITHTNRINVRNFLCYPLHWKAREKKKVTSQMKCRWTFQKGYFLQMEEPRNHLEEQQYYYILIVEHQCVCLTKYLQVFHFWHAKTRTITKCTSTYTQNLEVDMWLVKKKNQMSIDTLEIEMAQIEMILGNLRTIYYNSSIRKT